MAKNTFKRLVNKANKLNNEMHAALVEFLKEHNEFIRTDNVERRDLGLPTQDNIYVISMQGDDEPNNEYRVLAVALFENQVCVLPDLSDCETILDMTDDEVLECDDWMNIRGDYVIQNATLYNLCECIREYV